MNIIDDFLLRRFFSQFAIALPFLLLIIVMQYMLKFFEDIVGKGVGVWVFAKLFFYFGIYLLPLALGLAVLLAALMTYGTLGEHSELVALKAAGFSPLRLLRPVFFAILFLSMASFYANSYYIPEVNLKAFLLLHNIRFKNPAFSLPEKQFYGGVPGYSIRVENRTPSGALQDIVIYKNQSKISKERVVVTAEHGQMKVDKKNDVLFLDLYTGHIYQERARQQGTFWRDFIHSDFAHMTMRFDLASYRLTRSNKRIHSHLRYGKKVNEIFQDVDSILYDIDSLNRESEDRFLSFFSLHLGYKGKPVRLPREFSTRSQKGLFTRGDEKVRSGSGEDLLLEKFSKNTPFSKQERAVFSVSGQVEKKSLEEKDFPVQEVDSSLSVGYKVKEASTEAIFRDLWRQHNNISDIAQKGALNRVSFAMNGYLHHTSSIESRRKRIYRLELEAYNRWALAMSCLFFFIIGASMGIIIRRGGLGLPVIITVSAFILFYVVTVITAKQAQQGLIDTVFAAFSANIVLCCISIGLFIRALRES